jgi:hypothetical protein
MRYWTLEEATAALPRVREQVRRLRALAGEAATRAARRAGNGHEAPSGNGQGPAVPADRELRDLVEELTSEGIVLRDLERGLIDFPARSPSGRDYLLCWLDGEDAIEWWHWPDAGFAGRTPLSDPPA